MEPFQLDFPIPEIGAEVGDWIQFHPTKGVFISRQLSPDRVTRLRSRLRRVLAVLDLSRAQESAGLRRLK